MGRVLNKHSDFPGEGAVYIGRPSKWGNPFPFPQVAKNREQSLEMYREYLEDKLKRNPKYLEPLRGVDMVCFCSPLPCHGDIIKEFLDASNSV